MTSTSYVALLRGINVGGRNPVAMPDLVDCFEHVGVDGGGFADVRTHLQSGNVLFTASVAKRAADTKLESAIEQALEKRFGFEIPTLVRSRDEFAATIEQAPADHGSELLRSDVFFLKAPLTAEAVLAEMPELRQGVDAIAPGPGALYFSRVKAKATKTRIQKLMAMPVFKQMTVRSWKTVTRLLELLDSA
ncbi:DUF1697 domain-containing protein [Agromyces aureus]|uniref:DUF1697 domain-containing protein n=1 Tax=Agromyces aureus TaxID=453304 RepID=A0A191WCY1_9MICO|nr:DUF1697 domain-containing protein [Agromyces aureus]ANJ26087.1 hypothetical protein ATC03_04405 [Agromyces aureus]